MLKFICRKIYNVSNNFAYYFRQFWFRRLFKSMGENSRMYGRFSVIKPENISFGANSTINDNCILNAADKIVIGDNVHISAGATLLTAGLYKEPENNDRPHFTKPIEIKNGAWIGANAILLPGITVGENAIVGAGAVVTKDVQNNQVVAGVPAKALKQK
jgi:acetyltransferase-like isoleucine patch superfamily enzyme